MSSKASRKKQQAINIAQSKQTKQPDKPLEYSLGVDMKSVGTGNGVVSVYSNDNYTARGNIKGYDVDRILMNKQDNMNLIYDLMNFFVDADSIFNSVIKNVLTPFSVASGWKLQGSSEKTKDKYKLYFKQIGLNSLMKNIFYDLYLYGQCYLYDRGGFIQVLPPKRVRVASISVSGQPILEYCISEYSNRYVVAKEGFMDTIKEQYKGYPPEILEQLQSKGGTFVSGQGQYVQLDPENTYTIQVEKSMYEKYAIPLGVSCLKSFSKKTLISEYENSLLSIGAKSFLHVKVGDKDIVKTIDTGVLTDVGNIFKQAINGFPLAITAWNVDANYISVDTKGMFDKSKYNEVNNEILSGCGISPIVATGDSSSSNFASASINVGTTEKRISQNQNSVVEFIEWLMQKRSYEYRIALNKLPVFEFNAVDLQNDTKFKDTVVAIYQQGLISHETTIETLGFDYAQEKARREAENKNKVEEVFKLPPNANTSSSADNKGGAPEKPGANKDKSATGKQPKPSDK
ncbi:hypothetical protein [Clostridium sp.]|uniref:hypothetical protein n=1 Tax=Clostridium sp. TaxID=1506 RepID=UPI001A517C54|nr:hypothetical protein [Clostridium sp.]MBK5239807.1 hypothetical protein [Clostridium sp.]